MYVPYDQTPRRRCTSQTCRDKICRQPPSLGTKATEKSQVRMAEWVDAGFLTVETRVQILSATSRGKRGYDGDIITQSVQVRSLPKTITRTYRKTAIHVLPSHDWRVWLIVILPTQLSSRKYSKQDGPGRSPEDCK